MGDADDDRDGSLDANFFDVLVRDYREAKEFACECNADYKLLYVAECRSWREARRRRLRKALAFTLPLQAIARKYGLDRGHLRKRRDRLVAIGLLVPQGDGTYRIGKRISKHVNPDTGGPLYTPAQMEEIRAVARMPRAPRVAVKCDRTGTNGKAGVGAMTTTPAKSERPEWVPLPPPPGGNDYHPGIIGVGAMTTTPLQPDLANAGQDGACDDGPRGCVPAPARRKSLEEKKESPSPLNGPPAAPEPPRAMAASVDALPDLERWADRLPGHEMLHLGTWVGQMAGGYPLDWIRDAILAAATADPKRLKQYALRCLINRKADLDKPTPPPEPERPELRPLRDPALPPPTVKRYVPRPPRGREASA